MGPLGDAADEYVRWRRSQGQITQASGRTISAALRSFCASFGKRPVAQLGRAHVEAWLASMVADGIRPSTRRNYLSRLRMFCRWLVQRKRIARDPTTDIAKIPQPRTVPVVFTADEVADILDVCPDARARLIVLLLVQSGLRCVEVSRLEMGDVYRDHIRVIGKGMHERNVPIVAEVREALDEYLAERGGRAGPLIQQIRKPGLGIIPGTIGHMVRRWTYAAGVKTGPWDGKSAHTGRRTCATDMLELGAGIDVTAEALGHADLSSMHHYARASTKRIAKAMAGRIYRRHVIDLDQEATG